MLFFGLGLVFAVEKSVLVTKDDTNNWVYVDCVGCAYDWACHDRTKCKDEGCSDWDAARRAGFICEGFPWYQGGWPLGILLYEHKREFYTCLTNNQRRISYQTMLNTSDFAFLEYYDDMELLEEKIVANRLWKSSDVFKDKLQQMRQIAGFSERRRTSQTYCDSWETWAKTYGKQEFGECACDKEDGSGNFCAEWSCSQEVMPICEYNGCLTLDRYTCGCNCDMDDFCASNWTLPVAYEYKDCNCRHASEDRSYCEAWTCEENVDNETYIYYHEYNCTKDNEKYCTKWFGDIESASEFKKANCYCRIEGGNFCEQWICYEKGLPYAYPNYLWVLLPGFLSPICFCCAYLFEGKFPKRESCTIILINLLMSCWLSGVWGMLILVIFWTAPFVLLLLLSIFVRFVKSSESLLRACLDPRHFGAKKCGKVEPGPLPSNKEVELGPPPSYTSDNYRNTPACKPYGADKGYQRRKIVIV